MESEMLCRPLCTVCFGIALIASNAFAKDSEIDKLQGNWKVIELVEDGRVIPEEVISEWLPSGGRFHIVDGAIQFTSHVDGKKHVKLISIDETQSPKGIEIQTREKKRESWGIYRFEGEQLVVCLSDPEDTERPSSFSAKKGSSRMLLTLERDTEKRVAKPAATGPKAPAEASGKSSRVLSDAESAKMLAGVWRLSDALGTLVVTLRSDGTFSSARELQELRLLQKTFVQAPLSSGTWTVKDGAIQFHVTASTQIDRLNHTYAFILRSFSDTDMIYTDPNRNVGRAIRLK